MKKESCLLCIEPEGVADRRFMEVEMSVHVGAGSGLDTVILP